MKLRINYINSWLSAWFADYFCNKFLANPCEGCLNDLNDCKIKTNDAIMQL